VHHADRNPGGPARSGQDATDYNPLEDLAVELLRVGHGGYYFFWVHYGYGPEGDMDWVDYWDGCFFAVSGQVYSAD